MAPDGIFPAEAYRANGSNPPMLLTPRLRRVVLTVHVASSVGWLGAISAYLVLDLVATFGQDIVTVRAAVMAMALIVLSGIVPLALTAVLIGIVLALGTPWGLFRHYWVLVKLALTLFATTILLLETTAIRAMASIAATGVDPRNLPGSLPHSIGGTLVLLTILILAVYKPAGMTRYGWRKEQAQRQSRFQTRDGAAGISVSATVKLPSQRARLTKNWDR